MNYENKHYVVYLSGLIHDKKKESVDQKYNAGYIDALELALKKYKYMKGL
jgi:hypothetical protein